MRFGYSFTRQLHFGGLKVQTVFKMQAFENNTVIISV